MAVFAHRHYKTNLHRLERHDELCESGGSGVFHADLTARSRRFAQARLVLSEHAELVLVILEQIRHVEGAGRQRHEIAALPLLRSCAHGAHLRPANVALLDIVAFDATTAVRHRLRPVERHKVSPDFLDIDGAWCLGRVYTHQRWPYVLNNYYI